MWQLNVVSGKPSRRERTPALPSAPRSRHGDGLKAETCSRIKQQILSDSTRSKRLWLVARDNGTVSRLRSFILAAPVYPHWDGNWGGHGRPLADVAAAHPGHAHAARRGGPGEGSGDPSRAHGARDSEQRSAGRALERSPAAAPRARGAEQCRKLGLHLVQGL